MDLIFVLTLARKFEKVQRKTVKDRHSSPNVLLAIFIELILRHRTDGAVLLLLDEKEPSARAYGRFSGSLSAPLGGIHRRDTSLTRSRRHGQGSVCSPLLHD